MDRYVPDSSRHDTTSLHSPRKGHVDTSLPKNFAQPLTCFFWHQNGRCNKRDGDCAYAHWTTGHLAAAPVSVSGTPVAGRKAVYLQAHLAEQHGSSIAELRKWEHRLAAKEQELRGQEDHLRAREELVKKKASRLREKDRRLARRECVARRYCDKGA